MQYSIVYYIAGCVGVTRSLLWDKSCQLENYTFWGSVKNTSECAAAWGRGQSQHIFGSHCTTVAFISAYQPVKCAIQMQMCSVIKNVHCSTNSPTQNAVRNIVI